MKKLFLVLLIGIVIFGIIYFLNNNFNFDQYLKPVEIKNKEKIIGGDKAYRQDEEDKHYKVKGKYIFTNKGPETVINTEAIMAMIPNLNGYQKVISQNIKPSDFEEIKDDYGNIFAKFTEEKELKVGEKIEFTVEYEVIVNSFKNYLGQCQNNNIENDVYLKSEKFIESDDPKIIKTAQEIVSGKNNDCEKAYAIFNYIGSNMRYREAALDENGGAIDALNNKFGDCTYFTDLFIALSRASSIPARFVEGLYYSDDEKKDSLKQKEKHSWAEVYLNNSWTPVDATGAGADKNNPYNYFSESDGKHIIVTRGRNVEMLRGSYMFYLDYWNDGFNTADTDLIEDWEVELIRE